MTNHNKNEDCIFCKIVDGIIPSYKVYEDENVLAFLSNGPINAGHTLVIPKNHVQNWLGLSEAENQEVFAVSQKIAKNIEVKLNPKTVGVIIAGWDVPHTHVHLIPMHEYHDITSDKILNKTMPQFTPEEFSKTLEIIKL